MHDVFLFLFYIEKKHRGIVAGEITYVIQGDRDQFYDWDSYGFKLTVPHGVLPPDETCEVTITALVGGKYHFPPGADMTSVVYDIVISKPLLKDIIIEMQHCVALKVEGHLSTMSYGYAPYDSSTIESWFEYVDGGVFHVNSRYGSFHISKTGSFCIFAKR